MNFFATRLFIFNIERWFGSWTECHKLPNPILYIGCLYDQHYDVLITSSDIFGHSRELGIIAIMGILVMYFSI